MKFEFFISRKLWSRENKEKALTRPVILFSISSVVLGMVLMLISIATGKGLQHEIKEKIVGFTGHLSIRKYEINDSFEQKPILLNQDFYPEIKNLDEGFKDIYPFATKAGILKGVKEIEGAVLKGVNQAYPFTFFEKYLVEGKIPKFTDDAISTEILLSENMANIIDAEVGKRIQMYFIQESPKPPKMRYFEVVGIYNTGLEEFDNLYLIGDLKQVQRLNRWKEDEIGGFEVTVTDYDNLIPLAKKLAQETPFDLDVKTVVEENEQLFQWIALFDINIYLIIGIIVAVSFINMISVLLIIIIDRTPTIGILKALGTNNQKIRRIFIIQGTKLLGKGLILGNVIGLGLCLLQDFFKIAKLDPKTYYVNEVPIYWDISFLIGLNIAIIITGYIFLIIPSHLVAKISPARAIKFE